LFFTESSFGGGQFQRLFFGAEAGEQFFIGFGEQPHPFGLQRFGHPPQIDFRGFEPLESLQRLVRVGLYRFSRNPMYLSVLLVLVAWAVTFRSPALALYAVAVALAAAVGPLGAFAVATLALGAVVVVGAPFSVLSHATHASATPLMTMKRSIESMAEHRTRRWHTVGAAVLYA
jgi:hypothetical protein